MKKINITDKKITSLIIITCVTITLFTCVAYAFNESISTEIERILPPDSTFVLEYAGQFTINSWPVQVVAYTTNKSHQYVRDYYKDVLIAQGMRGDKQDVSLDYLYPASIRVVEIDILCSQSNNYYNIYIIYTDLIDKCLVVACQGIQGDIFTPGVENEGRDISDIPRYPMSKRVFSLEQGKSNDHLATYILYETVSPVEPVKEHFSKVLAEHGWSMWSQPEIPGFEGEVMFAFKDGFSVTICIMPDNDRKITSITIAKHSDDASFDGGLLWDTVP